MTPTGQPRAVYPANDFYGSELILRRAAEWTRPIKAVIPHGVSFSPYYTHNQISSWPVPYLLAYSWITEEWGTASRKHVALSAAPFVYFVDRVEPIPQAARVAPSDQKLLVFPSHSSAVVASSPPSDDALRRLQQLRSDGWSCTICMYWRDIDLGRSVPFERLDFQIVTCGHREDPAFTERLVRLILEHTVVAGEAFGSHMIYAAYLGRPYFSLVTPAPVRGPGTILDHYALLPGPYWTRFRDHLPDRVATIYAALGAAFGTVSLAPDVPAQHEIARQFLGADNVLSAPDLRSLFQTAQRADRFDRHPVGGAPRSPLLARQVMRISQPLKRVVRRARLDRG